MRSFTKRRLSAFVCFFLLISQVTIAQGDCTTLVAGSKERLACEYGQKAISYKQGSKTSQLFFDSAISINPEYAWAYYEKSVPYLKRGMLSEGMSILNKAVALEPLSYLTYRAYWFFQHKSFERCRADLEQFYAMEGSYQKNTPGGAMDMKIVLGLTYVQLGNDQRAIELISEVINAYPSEDHLGPYDYHTLGVLYLNSKQYQKAKEALGKSIIRNEQFADTYYYLALVAEALGNPTEAQQYIQESISRFKGEKPGYTGYPFCFPVTQEKAEFKIKELASH